MLVGDVPVQACQQLVVILVGGEVRPRAGVVAVLVLDVLRDGSHIGQRRTRQIVVGIVGAVLRGAPAVDNRRCLHHFAVDEEEELVLQDRTAECEAVGCLRVLGTCAGDGLTVDSIATQVLVLVIDVGTALEGVGTRLRDSVDATTDEVCLTNVEGRDDHLHLLDGFKRDGVTTAGELLAQTEVVVEVSTIDSEVSRTSVTTGEGHAVTAIRRQTGNVGDSTTDGRHGSNLG